MHEIIHVAEIGSTAVAASIAASHLGMNQVHLLMLVFFSVTLAGEFVSAMMARMRRVPLRKGERPE